MIKKLKIIVLLTLTMSLLACGGSAMTESTGEFLDSSAVTTKVKGRLADMLGPKAALAISVKTYKNKVQLSGFVTDYNMKQRAGIIAYNTVGVEQVRNNIIVK